MGKAERLPCIKCGQKLVGIFALHGGKGTGETTVYAAECSACGRTVSGLPSNGDGRTSSATREYLRMVSAKLAFNHIADANKKVQPALEKCEGCGREIHPSWPAFYTKRGAVCMMCEGAEIEVFRVSLPGDEGGYIDKEMPAGFFAGMDTGDAYTVHRESMRLLQYLNLPEFGGF